MIITVLAVSPHVHEYGSKRYNLIPPARFHLDSSVQAELEELTYILSASNPNRAFIYINENDLKEIGLTEEEYPTLPISVSSSGIDLNFILEDISRPAVQEEDFIKPETLPLNVEQPKLISISHENEDPEINEVVDLISIEEATRQDSSPEIINKNKREEELEALDWRKIKALAASYKIDYKEKAETIEKILEFEF
jgi:hypothetical protein